MLRQRLNKILIASAAITSLASCTAKHSYDTGAPVLAIPSQISLDAKASASQNPDPQQLASAKTLLQSVQQVRDQGVEPYILIPKWESDDDASKRKSAFAKLPQNYQQLATAISGACQIESTRSEPPAAAAGQKIKAPKITETTSDIHTTGAACTADLKKDESSKVIVLASNRQLGLNQTQTLADLSENSTFKDPAAAAVLGYDSSTLQISTNRTTEQKPTTGNRTYSEGSVTGSLDIQAGGAAAASPVQIQGTTKYLKQAGSETVVAQLTFKTGGQVFTYAFEDSNVAGQSKFLINGNPIAPDDAFEPQLQKFVATVRTLAKH